MPNDMLAQLAAERVARHGPPRAIGAALLEAAQDANPVALRRALASANAMRFDLRAEHDVAAEALFAVIDARSAWQDRLACVRMLLVAGVTHCLLWAAVSCTARAAKL